MCRCRCGRARALFLVPSVGRTHAARAAKHQRMSLVGCGVDTCWLHQCGNSLHLQRGLAATIFGVVLPYWYVMVYCPIGMLMASAPQGQQHLCNWSGPGWLWRAWTCATDGFGQREGASRGAGGLVLWQLVRVPPRAAHLLHTTTVSKGGGVVLRSTVSAACTIE